MPARRVKRTEKSAPKTKSNSEIPAIDDLNEPPDNFLSYRTVIYGMKGIGKTTLCASLSPRTLTMMFEPRRRNLKIRMVQFNIRSVEQLENGEVDPWKEFIRLSEQAIEDDSVDCINVDTIDLAYTACLNSVCHDEGVEHPGGLNDYGATWNAVGSEFRSKLDAIAESGIGMIFTSHANIAKKEINTGETVETFGPSAPSQAYSYLQQACDFAFFYGKHNDKKALHFRWDSSIWTACGTEDRFLSADGRKIAAIDMPSAADASKALLSAFDNNPSSNVLAFYDEDPEEEKPVKKKISKRRK